MIRIGSPTIAYSKNPNSMLISSSALWAIRLPGAPIRERLPPIAAAKTSGIRRRDLLYPDLAAIPMTTGISTAAVPVLESTPLINPTMTIMATISIRSVFANFVTIPPILFAIPVSNRAPPTINIATNKMTLLSMKPAKAVLTSSTSVTTRPTQTIMDVTPRGIFSNTNMTTAKRRKSRVIVAADIPGSPSLMKYNVSISSEQNSPDFRNAPAAPRCAESLPPCCALTALLCSGRICPEP